MILSTLSKSNICITTAHCTSDDLYCMIIFKHRYCQSCSRTISHEHVANDCKHHHTEMTRTIRTKLFEKTSACFLFVTERVLYANEESDEVIIIYTCGQLNGQYATHY